MRKLSFILACVMLAGCAHMGLNGGEMPKYAIPQVEAEWIQNGDPIVFEGKKWYPQDRCDVLLDSEVYYKGEYRGVPFFVEKIDVRPYGRVLTKFGRNKFRVFTQKGTE